MDTTAIIGYIAAALITAANIPQAYVIVRDKSAQNISPVTYGMLFLGGVCWVIYGICKNDWPVILCNGISSLTCGTIVVLKYLPAKSINTIHKTLLSDATKKKAKNK